MVNFFSAAEVTVETAEGKNQTADPLASPKQKNKKIFLQERQHVLVHENPTSF